MGPYKNTKYITNSRRFDKLSVRNARLPFCRQFIKFEIPFNLSMKSYDLALMEAYSVSMIRFQAFDDETGIVGILTAGETSLGQLQERPAEQLFKWTNTWANSTNGSRQ